MAAQMCMINVHAKNAVERVSSGETGNTVSIPDLCIGQEDR
jgi:hypothetical protein